MCVVRKSASGVGACGKSNNVVMLLPLPSPAKLARKFLPGLLVPTAVPRIPNACAVFAVHPLPTHTSAGKERSAVRQACLRKMSMRQPSPEADLVAYSSFSCVWTFLAVHRSNWLLREN